MTASGVTAGPSGVSDEMGGGLPAATRPPTDPDREAGP